jgi:hypothetical protein
VAALLLSMPASAGPPLLTNDTGTPGPGAWEINIASSGSGVDGGWSVDAPDLDLNYGVGERVQLSLAAAWSHRHDAGDGWASGLAPVEFAMRWRFLDQAGSGVSLAVQPAWSRSFSRAAERHGLADPGAEFVLPLQLGHEFGGGSFGVEVARHFATQAPDSWQAGAFVDLDCRPTQHCLGELNTTWDSGPRTVFDLGLVQALSPHANLLASVGRKLDGNHDAQAQFVFYLGAQLLY